MVTDWDRIVREHGPIVFATAWRILGHAADAEDVVQEVFLQAHQMQQLEEVRCWQALLRRLAACRALDRLRQRRATVPLESVSLASSIGTSPFPDKQTAPCWVEITHDGRFLFTVNTAVPSISRYRILGDGSLSLLGSTVFNDPTGLRPFDPRLDPSGRTLYVVDAGLDRVVSV